VRSPANTQGKPSETRGSNPIGRRPDADPRGLRPDGSIGDKVQCWQDDAAGLPKPDSERTTVYQLPGSRGVISVNCNFIFH
jgi:hypothetical protein